MDNNMDISVNPADYKILIVDDNVFNVQLLVLMLKKCNYQLTTANSGNEALSKVEQDNPDLILLDIMMPDISGYQVAETLKSNDKYKDIPILFLSALNSIEDIVKGFKIGADDYVTKPFNKDELITRISHHISLVAAKRKLIKQNEELKNLINERDKFYSLIAHDLRSPMGILKMSLNMLVGLKEGVIDEEMLEVINMANQTAEEMFEMLDNLLKWAKWQRGILIPVFQKFDITDLAHSVTDLYATISAIRKINISIEASKPIEVTLDIDMIKTVLRNLLNNSIKYSQDGSNIIVTVEDKGDSAYVGVRDFGKGIKKEDQVKIFDNNSNHTTYGVHNEEGSGLGLVICREFISKNHGTIGFESKEGEGSTFFFVVPKVQPTQNDKATTGAASAEDPK